VPKQNITYRGKQVKVDVPYSIRKGICECCGKKGFTARHHWKYIYKTKEVKKNPLLALENTTELCFGREKCHDVANAISLIHRTNQKIIDKLKKLEAAKEETSKKEGVG
jgi:hypothetical protein